VGAHRSLSQLAWLTFAFTAPAAAEPLDGMRAWTLDATVGPRRGEASGDNARLSLAWVPWRNLTPARTDRSWYVSVGALGAIGNLRRRTATGVNEADTRTLAPEVRTGIALHGSLLDEDFEEQYVAYLYLSASVGWMRAAAPRSDVHHHLTRV